MAPPRPNGLSHKIDYVIVKKTFLNPEGHQNRIIGSKVTVILLKGFDFAYWWSCIWKGLRLQPAQQAVYNLKSYLSAFGRGSAIKLGLKDCLIYE